MRGKAVKCKLVCNNRWGYVAAPVEYPSIRAALRAAKKSTWFAFRIFAGGRLVRRGFGGEFDG